MRKTKTHKIGLMAATVAGAFFMLATSVPAHETKAARRLEDALSGITIKLGRLDEKLRALNGQIEELNKTAKDNEKNIKSQYADTQESIKSLDRDVVRLKRAVKVLAERTPLAQRKRELNREQKEDLSKKSPNELYNYAISQLKVRRKFSESERAFEFFIREYPDNEKTGQALYWLGESFYVRGTYRDAARSYLRCYQSYPSSDKAPECLLRLGMAMGALHEWDEACSTYDRLRSAFPAASPSILQRLKREYERIQCGLDGPRG